MRVGILGASGYVGGELLRILLQHPKVEVTCATSKRYAGEPIHRVHSNLRKITDLKFMENDFEKAANSSDLIFCAFPHGNSVKILPKLVNRSIKIIDMSADFRLKDPSQYPIWYKYEHPHPDLLKKFIYGAPEIHREELKNASLVSCPGCMAIASIIALAPLAKNNLIEKDRIIVDVKIGSSGAGGSPSLATHHAERSNVVRPYKIVGHRHTSEIEQELKEVTGNEYKISMSAHAVNMVRGISSACHTFSIKSLTIPDLWKAYRGFYADDLFVRIVRDKKGLYRLPDPKIVIGSNYCDVGFELDEHINRIVSLSAIDNLIKGAAGTAVQCMNLMCGYQENLGLQALALHPV